MKILKSTQIIQYITLVYGILYLIFIIVGNFGGAYPALSGEGIGVYTLFLLFIVGVSVSWKNKIITGVLFFIWNIGMWIVELFFVEKDGGFGIISGIPLIVLGILFILKGMEKNREGSLKSSEKWKTAIRLLITINSLLYMIVIIHDITGNLKIDFSGSQGIILFTLFLIYCGGIIFTRKLELIAGVIFIFWYAGVLYIFTTDNMIGNSGPWAYAGFAVFIQGALHIVYYLKFKLKQIGN
jgi:hypothetical protein